MSTLIECLCCGERRSDALVRADCPRCGYIGWARTDDLNEQMRRILRERPPEQRRLRAVVA